MPGELIPILGIIFGCMIPISLIWTRHKEKIARMEVNVTAQHTAEKAAQYATHAQELEDRVRVLERIVTDKGYDIATQIEALRDQRSVDEGSGVPLNIEKKETV
ncbi:hypothetical protein [Aurantiacibacter rhizosphaerae]|uniref:Phage shock protein B n=1 Tax=Aurantiacibacter rhizosphaerae TaxID=2691582 RepID=A0A844XCT4_9SPHN|nr:hypothetical protein [Aurantiacibacter rhizosphaerae]MWV27502.1 hypothetical protein [Aurantiacibacter rhizosphaerae]